MAPYVHVGGRQGYSLQGVAVHFGGVQLGQGTAVLEVAGFSPVKAFSVPVEALEMAYGEDLVEQALPQEPVVPHALDCHPALGDVDSHGRVPHHHHCQCHQGDSLVDQWLVSDLPFQKGSREVRASFWGSEGSDTRQRWHGQR